MDYDHLYLIDNFYNVDGQKIRVTRDEKSGEVLECVQKKRLGDLNIYCPKRFADWRISVNLEVPAPHPLGTPTHTRRKDRMSYSHEEFKIDLTQVTSSSGPGTPVSPLRLSFILAHGAPGGDFARTRGGSCSAKFLTGRGIQTRGPWRQRAGAERVRRANTGVGE